MRNKISFTVFLLLILLPIFVAAQTTVFTYQGKLTDSGNLANGQYDLQFKLFDTATVGTGTQQGSTLTGSSITVTNGIFTVSLDFGVCASCFNGAARFLEISVKPTSGGSFTTLGPRQPITSTPYAIKSQNAATADGLSVACVNCITSSQIQSVNGGAVTGTIPVASVPAGSGNYVQNTTNQQATSNFNISGNGTVGGIFAANIVSATTQYNLSGLRMLSISGAFNNGSIILAASNTFLGESAGVNTTPSGTLNNPVGKFNTFMGAAAGLSNSTGNNNAFFGTSAGSANTTGSSNSFLGKSAGSANTAGSNNAFFGTNAGLSNATGFSNSFFGKDAGQANTTGDNNSFFGKDAGAANSAGFDNAFFGYQTGLSNTTGSSNAFFGTNAGLSNTTGNDNTFFGVSAGLSNTTGDDNAFFGRDAGRNNNANGNAFFGRSAGAANTTGQQNSFYGNQAGAANTTSTNNSFFGSNAGNSNTAGDHNAFFGASAGRINTGGNHNAFFGSLTGFNNTSGVHNSFFGAGAGGGTTTGDSNAFLGNIAGNNNTTGSHNTLVGDSADVASNNLTYATAIGADAVASLSNSIYLGRASGADAVRIPGATIIDGSLVVHTLGSAGSATLCLNAADRLAPCSSSRRYKANIAPFRSGLELINKLRPVSFTWKDSGRLDLGLVAEEVAMVEPLLTTTNAKGEIEGVKYDRIAVVLLNAVKEQQAQIEEQRKQLRAREQQTMLQQQQLQQQQKELAVLKQWYCRTHPKVTMCQPAKPTKR